MKPIAAVLVVLALAVPAVAEGPAPVNVALEGVECGKAAELIHRMSGLRILVAPEVAKRTVTVRLENAPPEKLVTALAEAAGTKAEKLGKTVWWVGPPATDRAAEIRRSLDDTKINLNLQGTAVPDALGFLAQMTGVSMAMDPAIRRAPEAMEVSLVVEGIAASQALHLLGALQGLKWDVRWGMVFLATEDRMKALPKGGLPKPEGEISEEETVLRAWLGRRAVSFDFAEAPLTLALEFVRNVTGVEIAIDEASRESLEKSPLSLAVRGLALGDALDAMLLPRGFTWKLGEKGVVVGK